MYHIIVKRVCEGNSVAKKDNCKVWYIHICVYIKKLWFASYNYIHVCDCKIISNNIINLAKLNIEILRFI